MGTRHSLIKSFGFAIEGIITEFKKGRNFRIQIFMGIAAIILGVIYKIPSYEWFDIILVIASVLILELINTAVESIVDMISPEIQEKAKVAKDVSAGAVLVASIAAVFVGALLFIPRIFH